MSFWSRLASRRPVEQRAGLADLAFAFPSPVTASGATVNTHTAENLSGVLACVNAITSALASLPARVYRVSARHAREEAPTHPVSRLIRAPNAHQTWPDLIETVMASVLLRGNALAVIERDGAGRAVALWPVPWSNVAPMLLPSGRLAYDVVAHLAPWGGPMLPRRFLAHEVFHLRDRSDDGLIGRSRISRAPETLGNALALQEWSSSQWRNGATPSGALTIDGRLQPPQFDALRHQFTEKFTGPSHARRPLILDNGMKWQTLSVSPEDAEVLDSRKFSIEELARIFQVPPPLIQDYSRNTFTNATTAGLWFAQFTLAPWARKIETEFARSIFGASSAGYEIEIDLSGLTRGDFAARWASYDIAVRSDILDRNEIREAEGYGPRDVSTSV